MFAVAFPGRVEYSEHIKLSEQGEIPVVRAQNVRPLNIDKKNLLLAEKAVMLIKNQRVKDLNFEQILNELQQMSNQQNFNIYRHVKKYTN